MLGPVFAYDNRITSQGQGPDPVLNGEPTGPCDPDLASPGYVGGTDIHGQPVVSADVNGGQHVVLGSDSVYPEIHTSGAGDAIVPATVPGLKDAVNPPPACPRPYPKG